MRLDKFLAQAGIGTRSEVKKIIRKGRVLLDGEVAKKGDEKVLQDSEVLVDGNKIEFEEYEYFMLNKPAGVVSATKDNIDTTVVELIKDTVKKDLFPVGRLDKDTEGLLIITNDGKLSHDLLSPSKHVDKTYQVIIDGVLDDSDKELLENGVDIGDDLPTKPAKISDVSVDKNRTSLMITISEGRYHQIKRMFLKTGTPVIYLKRVSMGKLKLDDKLELGEYRKLTKQEIALLREG